MNKKFKKRQYNQLIFIIFLFIYLIILAQDFYHIPYKATIFPKIIMVLILFLGVLKLISVIFPKFSSIIEPPSLGSSIKKEFSQIMSYKGKKEKTNKNRPIIIWVWIISLVTSFYLFGLFISIPIGIFIFLFFIEKKTLTTSLLISSGTIITVYFIFIIILRTPVVWGILIK